MIYAPTEKQNTELVGPTRSWKTFEGYDTSTRTRTLYSCLPSLSLFAFGSPLTTKSAYESNISPQYIIELFSHYSFHVT